MSWASRGGNSARPLTAKSATSTTKSDTATLKTFVTFRLAGDTLDPEEVTRALRAYPTHAHRKGEQFTTGRSTVVPDTGVWLLSTDKISLSDNFYEHLQLALEIIGFFPVNRSGERDSLRAATRCLEFKQFLQDRKLTATLSCFWHGAPRAPSPHVPEELSKFFELIPIGLDIDFDRDEAPRRSRATAPATPP